MFGIVRIFALAIAGAVWLLAAESAHPTADLLSEILKINTSNPPGHEAELAALLASKFKPLGFEIDIINTPETGKAHFIARLKGDGTQKPILIAAHADVVGVEDARSGRWIRSPASLKTAMYMAAALSTSKVDWAVFAQAVLMIARNKVPLHRDIYLPL